MSRIKIAIPCCAIWLVLTVLLAIATATAQAQPVQSPDTLQIPAGASLDSLRAARTPRPPVNVRGEDLPNDAGGSIEIKWAISQDDISQTGKVKAYRIERAAVIDGQPGPFTEVGAVTAGTGLFSDGRTSDDTSYVYRVVAINDSTINNVALWRFASESEPSQPVKSSAQWFDWRRINVFVGVIILCLFIIYYISQAKAGKELFIRRIAGLEAVDEAVGRATEMGKKIFYIPGSQDMDNVQTLAGITILGRVAELAAQYDSKLEVPVSRSLVMVTCREVVKESFVRAGRADGYHDDMVRYLTDDQFGYAAAIDGMVVRERPATIFLMGSFYAESLVLAETGNSVGAIQIAGTGQPSQLPFFVAACDYTLIGEELFAASAYLSKEPRQLGSLKGQDIGKGLILVAIVFGIILESFHIWNMSKLFTVIE